MPLRGVHIFEEISEHGIFHGIAIYQEIKPLIMGLHQIEWVD